MNQSKLKREFEKLYGKEPTTLEFIQFEKNRIKKFKDFKIKCDIDQEVNPDERLIFVQLRREKLAGAIDFVKAIDPAIWSRKKGENEKRGRQEVIKKLMDDMDLNLVECSKVINEVLGYKRMTPSTIAWTYNAANGKILQK